MSEGLEDVAVQFSGWNIPTNAANISENMVNILQVALRQIKNINLY
jgi:hypothetical protein